MDAQEKMRREKEMKNCHIHSDLDIKAEVTNSVSFDVRFNHSHFGIGKWRVTQHVFWIWCYIALLLGGIFDQEVLQFRRCCSLGGTLFLEVL